MISQETLFENAIKLKPVEKANLIEGLMASLENPDSSIDSIWEEEALKRYNAYKKGQIAAKDLDEVLKKYE